MKQTGRIAILGQGFMGAAIAAHLLEAGHSLIVWNRTADKCAPARDLGASVARTPEEAVAAADMIICIIAAIEDLVPIFTASPGLLEGKDVVCLITATPAQVRRIAGLVAAEGGHFLNGQIQCFPSGIGSPQSVIVCGGDPGVWERRGAIVRSLAGGSVHADAAPDFPNVMDTAVMGCFLLVAEAAFHEAIGYAAKEGVTPEKLARYWPSALDSVRRHIDRATAAIPAGNLSTSEAPLRLYARSFALFEEAMADAGASNHLVEATHRRMRKAMAAGDGELGYMVLHRH